MAAKKTWSGTLVLPRTKNEFTPHLWGGFSGKFCRAVRCNNSSLWEIGHENKVHNSNFSQRYSASWLF
jgi:hypothetical protein